MKKRILNLVNRFQHVSFVELCRDIPGFQGDLTIAHAEIPNIILWTKVSQEGLNALAELMASGQIHINIVNKIIYVIDGKTPALKIAKDLRPYKSPRWLPVTFSK